MEPLQTIQPESMTSTRTEAVNTSRSTAASVSVAGNEAKAGIAGRRENTANWVASLTSSYQVPREDKIVFPALHYRLSKFLELSKTRLFILFDEWSSLPADIQPYLAEFLKRGILPVRDAVLKIASLEHRSRFTLLV
jgi:hypothetical protein